MVEYPRLSKCTAFDRNKGRPGRDTSCSLTITTSTTLTLDISINLPPYDPECQRLIPISSISNPRLPKGPQPRRDRSSIDNRRQQSKCRWTRPRNLVGECEEVVYHAQMEDSVSVSPFLVLVDLERKGRREGNEKDILSRLDTFKRHSGSA